MHLEASQSFGDRSLRAAARTTFSAALNRTGFVFDDAHVITLTGLRADFASNGRTSPPAISTGVGHDFHNAQIALTKTRNALSNEISDENGDCPRRH